MKRNHKSLLVLLATALTIGLGSWGLLPIEDGAWADGGDKKDPKYSIMWLGDQLRGPRLNEESELVAHRGSPGERRPVYISWSDGRTEIELPMFDDAFEGEARDLNNVGQVVGTELLWSEDRGRHLRHPVLWEIPAGATSAEGIGLYQLPIPEGAVGGVAERINDAGQVAGRATYWDDMTETFQSHPILWMVGTDHDDNDANGLADAAFIELPLNEAFRGVWDITDPAEGAILIMGMVRLPTSDGYSAPCIWEIQFNEEGTDAEHAEHIVLPHEADIHHHAHAMNQWGDVVCAVGPFSEGRSMLWQRGDNGEYESIDLGTLEQSSGQHEDRSDPRDINSSGQVVGQNSAFSGNPTFPTGHPTAYLWEDGAMVDLNELLPDGFEFSSSHVLRINEWGQILGTSRDDDGWYLATPIVEEPPSEEPPGDEPSGPVEVTDIHYSGSGGPNGDRHLRITVTVQSDGEPVSGATVSIELLRDGSLYAEGDGTTAGDGTVTFSVKHIDSGTYTTVVTELIAGDDLEWDGETPENEWVKEE